MPSYPDSFSTIHDCLRQQRCSIVHEPRFQSGRCTNPTKIVVGSVKHREDGQSEEGRNSLLEER